MFENPLGIRSLGSVLSTVLIGTVNGLAVLGTVILAAAFVSLAVRYRSGGRDMRQQIKWIALAAAVLAVCQLVALLALAATGNASNPVTVTAYVVVPVMALFGIPAIITLAILKYGLYQIDVIISRTVVYALLSAAFTGVYIGIVLGIGTFVGHQGGPVLTIAAAVTIALLFQPLRHRSQLFANRLVYGQRATPYQALSDFAGHRPGSLTSPRPSTRWCRSWRVRPEPTGPKRGSGSARNCAWPQPGRTGRPCRPRSRSAPATASRPSREYRARWRSGTVVNCSVHCPCGSRGTSR
jgi:hypothetical protein